MDCFSVLKVAKFQANIWQQVAIHICIQTYKLKCEKGLDDFYAQTREKVYKHLLNKPYVNEINLREQNQS